MTNHINSCVLCVCLLFNFCLFTIIDLSPEVLFARQVVSEPMAVCGEGGKVFMVPSQQGQRKPKRPTHKDPETYIYIYILLMVLNNGVIQDSHGHGRAGFPWMCVQG